MTSAPGGDSEWLAETYAVYECTSDALLLGSNVQICDASANDPHGTWRETPQAKCVNGE